MQFARGSALRFAFRPMYACGTKLGNAFAIVRLGEELVDALGENRSDVLDVEQSGFVSGHQWVETAEVPRQVLGGLLADVPGAQRVDEARQRGCPALVD